MKPNVISIGQAVAALESFDAVIDVRSPAEFADDHLPGAVNWPVLDDAQRKHIGTTYVQVSPFEARKAGAALVARRIAAILEQQVAGQPRGWQPLVYCWRGGQRSGSLALVLAQIGFHAHQVHGGYKAFRAQVRADLEAWPARFDWQVLSGRTGSGKTRLLAALAQAGAQVLDLEALACHRGSVLGRIPEAAQPSQKRFETLLWAALRAFDAARPVFVEAESRRIGQRQLPDALLTALRDARIGWRIELPLAARCQLLQEDYPYFIDQPEMLCERLADLTELRGKARVERWQSLARAHDWAALLPELLEQHYDPLYDQSNRRHFGGPAAHLTTLPLPDGSEPSLRRATATMTNMDIP